MLWLEGETGEELQSMAAGMERSEVYLGGK